MKIKELRTERLVLRTPLITDAKILKDFEVANAEHLSPWETLPKDPVENRLLGLIKDVEDGRSVRFFIFLKDHPEGPIVGMCNFTQIFRGFFQACFLGYKIGKDYEGQGMMFEALNAGIKYMFEKENLHRVMANYMPKNDRSGKLLKRLGFVIEGHAKDYLLINGVWEDHVLTALVNRDWQ